jgi:peptide/nickel transport system substrate-binding protein
MPQNPSLMSGREFDLHAQSLLKRHVLSRRTFLGASMAAGAAAMLPFSPAFAEPKPGGIFRVGKDETPDTLDPQKTSLSVSQRIMDYLYEPLARRDLDGNTIPGAAKEWEFINDNKTIVFHLMPDGAFHDGSPLDAAAVEFTILRHLDDATASPTKQLLGPLEKVEVIDPSTIAFHYKDPYAPIWVGLTLAFTAPLSKAAVEEKGDNYGRSPVGAGPFKFLDWTPDRGIRLARHDDYKFAPVAFVDGVEYIHYPADATRIAALETGEIHAIYGGNAVPVDAVSRIRGNSDLALLDRPATLMRALSFNTGKAPMDNPKVRQAIAHAVNPEMIVAIALNNTAVVAKSPLPSSVLGQVNVTDEFGFGHDPEKARALLKEEGVEGLKINMLCNDTAPIRRTAEVIQQQLNEVGIELALNIMPTGQYAVEMRKGEQDLTLATYTYAEADVLYLFFEKSSALNTSFHKDDELNEMVVAQRREVDWDKRKAILADIQKRIVENVYWLPLFEPNYFAAVTAEVQDARLAADGEIQPQTIWLDM